MRRDSSICIVASVFAVGCGMISTTVSAAERRDFDIPADSAEISVRKFARQADLSVLYKAGRLARFKTRELKGSYEPIQGLKMLLEGSGLTFSITKSRLVSIEPSPPPVQAIPESEDLPTVRIPGWMSRSDASLPAGVTLRRVTADDLAQAGFATIPDWVRTLTQNQGSGATEDTHNFLREAPTNTAYGTGINLYGIGQRATLILVNGRRLAPSGSAGSFTDVANIPISAIDHIDVISDGAATIYGSDAVGGVVDFVLRGAPSTAVPAAAVARATSGSMGERLFSQSLAHQWERGSEILAVEYYSRHELLASARSQGTSDLVAWGGSDFNAIASNPATIIDSQGRLWGVPGGQNGTSLTPPQLLPYPNTADREAGTWLLPRQERLNLVAGVTYLSSDSSSLFFDALLNRRKINIHNSPSTGVLSVPSTNAFYVNPMRNDASPVTVLYAFGGDLGPIVERGRVDSGQFAVGFNHELSQMWSLRGYLGYTFEDQHDVEHGLVNFGVLQSYLSSSDRTIAFNPFGDGSSTNPATLAAIRADGWLNSKSDFTYGNLMVLGEVPFLPAGPLNLTVGYNYRVQTFNSTLNPSLISADLVPTPATDRDRTASALFVQTSAPVLSLAWRDQWPLRLDVSGGLRYEHYSDAGVAITPSLGFDLRPANGLSLKGTWAQFFRPPNLPDLDEAPNISETIVLPDPKSATGYTQALVWSGNNANLRAETGHSWTLGLSISLPSHPNIEVQTSYFNIVSSNRVVPLQFLPLTVFSDTQYGYLVNRNVTSSARADVCAHSRYLGLQEQCLGADIGALLDMRLRNVETVSTDGFDITARYAKQTPIGDLALNFASTYFLHFDEAQTPLASLVDYRNTPHYPPALRLRGSLNWSLRGFSVSPAMSFQSSYRDTDSVPNRPVDAWMTWDLVLGYQVRPLDLLWGGETQLTLSGYNVFNKQPPFLNNAVSTIGYDPENGDLLGRRVSFAIEHRW